jgi:iron complex outermembrane recepter protein
MKFFYLLFFNFLAISVFGQFTISGSVSNDSGEKLETAIVHIPSLNLAQTTDVNGTYSISNVPAGNYEVHTSYLGYETHVSNISVADNLSHNIIITGLVYKLNEVEIVSNRNVQVTYPSGEEIKAASLRSENLGQDVPYLLQNQTSIVTTSDAGAGVGYTGMRIRGVDASRINVTINDVPLNEAESQGVYWVDLPDIASSTQSIYIQRGVGPSTNGAGAYGGTVSLNTFGLDIKPSVGINASYGSFNTRKLNVKLNSGLLNNKYNVEARYSTIGSNGYIDRASSKLNSWYVEAARVGSTSSLRFISFSGHERTYQSWYGTPQSVVDGDKDAILNHYFTNQGSLYKTKQDSINLFTSGRTFNFYTYPDQVDDYTQHHNQLHYAKVVNKNFKLKGTAHYRRGKGYYEQYRTQDKLSDYGIEPIEANGVKLLKANLVRRRWLDNHFFGGLAKAEINTHDKGILSIGGGYNIYEGLHYGNIIKIEALSGNSAKPNHYYGQGDKKDGNVYSRYEVSLSKKLGLSTDLQYRYVHHFIDGRDNDLRQLGTDKTYHFFNPKFAVEYKFNSSNTALVSWAVANREPDRSDFTDHSIADVPNHETLYDTELSWVHNTKKWQLQSGFYFMNYKNQLVLTGALNDVGSSLRQNVHKSYRTGMEITSRTNFGDLFWNANATLSKNKIAHFTETIYDYTNGFDVIENKFTDVDIAFSPNVILGNELGYKLGKSNSVSLLTKYVGKQYLDNTNNEARKLSAYTSTNLRWSYTPSIKNTKQVAIDLQVNNVFNSLYSSNGYTYSYKYDTLITENFLYPQAGLNAMLGLSIVL